MIPAPAYRLWSGTRGSWCDVELQETDPRALQAIYPPDWDGRHLQVDFDVEIAPEPCGPLGEWSLAVRARGMTLGYLPDGRDWAEPVRRIVASGFRPTTNGHVWGYESPWNATPFEGVARINLGESFNAIPINDPPTVPYTLLPRGAAVQATKEEDHADTLLKHVPANGRGAVIVTLHEREPPNARAKPHVEIRIDDERIGQLTPQMSQRFIPMIRHLAGRGLLTAARGDIEGSQVAAKVRIDSIKANEADDHCLNGPPVSVPRLVACQHDLLSYDLNAVWKYTRPRMSPPERLIPPELPDGTLVRFSVGRYVYLALRHGRRWETTATGDGVFRETMTWEELTSRVRTFEVPAAWSAMDESDDGLVRKNCAVIHFYVGGQPMAALCVLDDRYESWYSTMTAAMEDRLAFYKRADWPDIAAYGARHHLVTEWRRYPPI